MLLHFYVYECNNASKMPCVLCLLYVYECNNASNMPCAAAASTSNCLRCLQFFPGVGLFLCLLTFDSRLLSV